MGTAERRQREKEQRRNEIITAAKDIFFGKGLEASTMDEIADRAELSKGTLYLYFQSKEELYLSLLSEGTEIITRMMKKSIMPKMNAEQKLRSIGGAYFRFYHDYPQYFKIMFLLQHGEFSEDKVSGDVTSSCMDEAGQTLNLVESVLIEGVDNKEFHIEDTWQATLFVWAAINGVFSIAHEEHQEFMKDFEPERLFNYTQDRIIASLK